MLVVTLPLGKRVTERMIAIRARRLPVLDERVRMCSEMVAGIKVSDGCCARAPDTASCAQRCFRPTLLT